jgi:signal transduction histidine kinase
MARRAGVGTEVLASLALVMLLATVLLSAVWIHRHESGLRAMLGRALLAEARHGGVPALFPGTDWWVVSPDGRARPRGGVRAPIDAESVALADQAAHEQQPLVQPGPVWSEIRFAAPLRSGEVAVARLPKEASVRLRLVPIAVASVVLVADVAIFTALGTVLLRRRVVGPLQRLAGAVRSLAHDVGVRVPEEGTAEVAELGRAFNEMGASLGERTEELEKAVVDLRGANRELRETREGLERADRLAAVGQLAAGVAHEVGNPMGAMLAFLELAGRDPGASDETRRLLERAGREGVRVSEVLRQLLDFSRPARGRPECIDLAVALRESLDLLSAQRRYAAVRFEVDADGATPPGWVDRGALSQVLLNLLLNAANAVAGVTDPVVRVCSGPAVRSRRRDDAGLARTALRERPDAARICVYDNGCGIPDAHRERIFDAFFTTRDPGQGTGLGLANASRLAEEWGGRLELCEVPVGFRTGFSLLIPTPPAAESAARGPKDAADPANGCARG